MANISGCWNKNDYYVRSCWPCQSYRFNYFNHLQLNAEQCSPGKKHPLYSRPQVMYTTGDDDGSY